MSGYVGCNGKGTCFIPINDKYTYAEKIAGKCQCQLYLCQQCQELKPFWLIYDLKNNICYHCREKIC